MIDFNENNEIVVEKTFKAIIACLDDGLSDIEYSMDELERLAEACGCIVMDRMVQNADRRNTATYIGSGKVNELRNMVEITEADTVIFNDELSGMQLRNLEDALGVRVIDRTILILDIFAKRATSGEGKLQVELAQLEYRLPRLMGFGKSLSRQGGGIGTRGPGEKKLETDRRHIEKRMNEIKSEIKALSNTRNTQRQKREKSNIPIVALVGYTNAGKSALMNRLLANSGKENKMVGEKDMLFATLDTSQRSIKLDSNHEFILIDTVGFVSKLPHALVSAFKSTLEEVKYADLLIHVIDISHSEYDENTKVTESVLSEIGITDKEIVRVYNKMDLLDNVIPLENTDNLFISAKENKGIDKLLEKIKEKIFSNEVEKTFIIPFSKGAILSYLNEKAKIIKTEYLDYGTKITCILSSIDANRYGEYIVEDE